MTDPKPVSSPRQLKPHQRQQLCRELAANDITRADLARKYGMTTGGITHFADRNAARIAEIAANLDDQFTGLWAASKASRIATYEDEIERLDNHPNADHHEWSKARQAALRAIADELGEIPNKQQVALTIVKHELEGVNVDDLG